MEVMKINNYQIFFHHSHSFVPLKERMKDHLSILSVCQVLPVIFKFFFHIFLMLPLRHTFDDSDLVEFEIQPRRREKLLRLLIAFNGGNFFRIIIDEQLSLRMMVLLFRAVISFDVLKVVFGFDTFLYCFVPKQKF